MDSLIAIGKALSDRNRLRALMALRGGELCVCQIIELLGLAASTVSRHMAILRQAGLVVNRKEERWMYYRLAEGSGASKAVRGAIAWTVSALEGTAAIRSDHDALTRITKRNPSSLCRSQRGK